VSADHRDPPDWETVRGILLAEGWIPHAENGMVGVCSPHDAIFFVPEDVAKARFSGFIKSLARQVATPVEQFGDTDDPQIMNVLDDLRRLLTLLTER